MRLLAQREHSALELWYKLRGRGFDEAVIGDTLESLKEDNLLSDARFTENYIRSRMAKGFGVLRIQAELRERGISDELIAANLSQPDSDWLALASEVRQKKFGWAVPHLYEERMKQARFLQYRGFTAEHIYTVLSNNKT